MFQKLHKPKGYPFTSVELGRVVTTDAKERVIAQVDTTEAVEFINKMIRVYSIPKVDAERMLAIAENCHGMIHIFSPDQVELIDSFVPEAHGKGSCICEECSEK